LTPDTDQADPDDDVSQNRDRPCSDKSGDVWLPGEHKLICGDAQKLGICAAVMKSDCELAMASGKMDAAGLTAFLENALGAMANTPGSPAPIRLSTMWRPIVR